MATRKERKQLRVIHHTNNACANCNIQTVLATSCDQQPNTATLHKVSGNEPVIFCRKCSTEENRKQQILKHKNLL